MRKDTIIIKAQITYVIENDGIEPVIDKFLLAEKIKKDLNADDVLVLKAQVFKGADIESVGAINDSNY